jgi:hypothetical protein
LVSFAFLFDLTTGIIKEQNLVVSWLGAVKVKITGQESGDKWHLVIRQKDFDSITKKPLTEMLYIADQSGVKSWDYCLLFTV